MIINTQIKKHRLEMNMSQDKLAEKMFISRQSISKWENGETLPSVENLIILSEILEIPLDELVKGKRSYPMPFYFGNFFICISNLREGISRSFLDFYIIINS